jgi:hypothetical protein
MLQAQSLCNRSKPYFYFVIIYLNKTDPGSPRGYLILKENQLLAVILNDDCS